MQPPLHEDSPITILHGAWTFADVSTVKVMTPNVSMYQSSYFMIAMPLPPCSTAFPEAPYCIWHRM
jgi:hypothetical protein